jgi:UDP-N-acetylglucosamine 2-epimerase (non-hydrolysing)
MKKILTVVGTRPNFIKITQFHKAFKEHPEIDHKLLHTGQHFDKNMSDVFFDELKIPKPDYHLGVSSSSVITQQTEIMLGLEKVFKEFKPDIVNVVGDVNSTFSAAFVAQKFGLKIAHIESGLRSYDRTMPEEINRLLTDVITDYYFVTEQSGYDNLITEGKSKDQIFFVGNTMIDTLYAFKKNISNSSIMDDLGIKTKQFCLVTMHRPATVDFKEECDKLITLLTKTSDNYDIVFPIHPRTQKNLEKFGLYDTLKNNPKIHLLGPLGYLDFQNLVSNSIFCLTDSGGIQEETTYLQVPCITLRPNTERPSTVDIGTNTLINFELDKVFDIIKSITNGTYKRGNIPELWDGNASFRIAKILNKI